MGRTEFLSEKEENFPPPLQKWIIVRTDIIFIIRFLEGPSGFLNPLGFHWDFVVLSLVVKQDNKIKIKRKIDVASKINPIYLQKR